MLDLYQNPKNKLEAPDSPPQQPPSKASPPAKKFKLQHSPVNQSKHVANQIPVKVSSNEQNIYSYASTSHNPYGPAPTANPPLPAQSGSHHKPPLPPLQISSQIPLQPPLSQTRFSAEAARYSGSGYYPPPMNYPPHKNRSSNQQSSYHQSFHP